MKILSLFFLLLLVGQTGAAQQAIQAPIRDVEQVPNQQDFGSAGEQEDYWARKLFQEQYRYQPYPRFKGTIRLQSSIWGQLALFNNDSLHVDNSPFALLFTTGILYPGVAGYSFRGLGAIRELANSTNAYQRRRFTMLADDGVLANPIVYVFELTNLQAPVDPDLPTFLEGAVLTFIKKGWLMQ